MSITHVNVTVEDLAIEGEVLSITCIEGYELVEENLNATCARVNSSDPYRLAWLHKDDPCQGNLHYISTNLVIIRIFTTVKGTDYDYHCS